MTEHAHDDEYDEVHETDFDRALVRILQRRDPSRRWRLNEVSRPGQSRKTTSDRLSNETPRADRPSGA